jgi:predicted nucleotidyltransferase
VDDAHDGPYAREPQVEDLARICRALNGAGARYILIGGFAVIAHGGARTTKDIDLLVDASPDNISRVREALRVLEDRAVDDVADTDVARYAVVRVADEIVVDLMAQACGVEYAEAARDVVNLTLAGVVIPVASLATLIRTKDTVRPSDAADRRYLEELLRAEREQS